MRYCLDKSQSKELLDLLVHDIEICDQQLLIVIESARIWEDELYVLMYFALEILMNKMKSAYDPSGFIYVLCNAENDMRLRIQGFDIDYIDLMLKSNRNQDVSLDDDLIAIQQRIMNYKYA